MTFNPFSSRVHTFHKMLRNFLFPIVGFSLILFALSACSTMKTQDKASVVDVKESSSEIVSIIRNEKIDVPATTPGNEEIKSAQVWVVNEEVRGRKIKNNKFDYPVMINAQVEQWIDYFTGKGRIHFEKYLQRSRYFIPVISKVLKTNNMPHDLVYLAMIESGFNNVARSRAAAVGPWQFIRATGRRYGLNINYWLDERRDTRKSTMAAIAYLRELNQEFNSWELAAASYNAGENKIRTAIRRYKTHDFWEISRHRYLRPETRHYVPKIMAAAIISKNPEAFGFDDPFSGKVNPTLLDPSEPAPKDLGEEEMTAQNNEKAPAEETEADVAANEEEGDEEDDLGAFASHVEDGSGPSAVSSVYMVNNPTEQIIEFEVKGPTDLFAVSRAAGIPFSNVKMLNPELLRWCTPPDMKTYRVKLPLSSKDKFLSQYNNEKFDRKVEFAEYKVQRGDTVTKVAKKFSTQPEPIRQLNNFSDRANGLVIGTKLVLPIPTGYKRVIASLYDEKPLPERRRRRWRRRHVRQRTSAQVFQQTSSAVKKSRLQTRLSSKKTL